jgi:hypothetical protein
VALRWSRADVIEQRLDEPARPLRLLDEQLGVTLHLGRQVLVLPDELRERNDRGQWVVELVLNTWREPPEGGNPVRPDKCLDERRPNLGVCGIEGRQATVIGQHSFRRYGTAPVRISPIHADIVPSELRVQLSREAGCCGRHQAARFQLLKP